MGMMLFSLNNGSHTLYLFLWGLLSALSANILPITFIKAISRWFHEKRGLALGIVLVGTGIGGTVAKFMFACDLVEKEDSCPFHPAR